MNFKLPARNYPIKRHLREKITEAKSSTTRTKSTKKYIIRASFESSRAHSGLQRVTRSLRLRAKNESNEISLSDAKFVRVSGDILQSGLPFAHCVSSDLVMGAGLADQVNQRFLEIKKSSTRWGNLPIGSVMTYFDSHSNLSII